MERLAPTVKLSQREGMYSLPRQPRLLEPRLLASGFAYVESARWRDGQLWFAHWGAGEIVAIGMDGRSEVMAPGPSGLGWSIDWLPDGLLLVTGPELMRWEADGSMVRHADLSGVADHGWNEIVVDGRGNIYLNGFGFDFLGGGAPEPGIIALVTPDGGVRQVADGIEFPNGMVVTPDNSTLIVAESFAGRLTAFDIGDDGSLSNRRVWAEGLGPDGICLDAEGAVWTHSADSRREGDPAAALPYGYGRAATCWTGSSSIVSASPAPLAALTARRYSCSTPTGVGWNRSRRHHRSDRADPRGRRTRSPCGLALSGWVVSRRAVPRLDLAVGVPSITRAGRRGRGLRRGGRAEATALRGTASSRASSRSCSQLARGRTGMVAHSRKRRRRARTAPPPGLEESR